MKNIFFVIFFILGFQWVSSQDTQNTVVDSLYKEDHFYAGITYNLLGNIPSSIKQSGFSTGFHFGYIKDMPINKNRNVAIGVGLGYSANSFNQNLLVNQNVSGDFEYSILKDRSTYSKNKFSMHLVEMPIEFRWRTSTPTVYDFWRIYTGFKLGYVFRHTTKHVGDLGVLKYGSVDGFNDFQYGLTLSVGYGTWNFHLYYALNPIFSDIAKIDGESIDMNAIKVGLMFYIL
ncbi:porin family protein [Hwangdonia seohaensis]|uniref:Porin family protein n=1 Tax=Hwangdonia seohaensis TaxID=1240727 RepID=A0ABW3R9L7_9FLAO|nr:porin family protein [Hwangdonia seohaensis]